MVNGYDNGFHCKFLKHNVECNTTQSWTYSMRTSNGPIFRGLKLDMDNLYS